MLCGRVRLTIWRTLSILERIQWLATMLDKGYNRLPFKGIPRRLGLRSLNTHRFRGYPVAIFKMITKRILAPAPYLLHQCDYAKEVTCSKVFIILDDVFAKSHPSRYGWLSVGIFYSLPTLPFSQLNHSNAVSHALG